VLGESKQGFIDATAARQTANASIVSWARTVTAGASLTRDAFMIVVTISAMSAFLNSGSKLAWLAWAPGAAPKLAGHGARPVTSAVDESKAVVIGGSIVHWVSTPCATLLFGKLVRPAARLPNQQE